VYNYGTITTANGGSANGTYGCDKNYGTITTADGGSASNAYGCRYNYSTITEANGGSASGTYGCRDNYGTVLESTDSTERAVYQMRGSIKFVDGPGFTGEIVCDADYSPLETLYVMTGEFAGTLPSDPDPGHDADIVELFPIGGGGGRRSRARYIGT
jgi:hypothetical protein